MNSGNESTVFPDAMIAADVKPRTVPWTVLVIALVMALVATACGASNAAILDTASGANDSVSHADGDAADAVEEAQGSIVSGRSSSTENTVDDAMEDDAMEEQAVEDGAMDEQAVEAPAAQRASADSEGMFDDSAAAAVAPEELDRSVDGDAEGLFDDAVDTAIDERDAEADRLQDNRFADYGYRTFIETDVDPLSTFALDVDTGSWTVARRWLDEGVMPPVESVRVEEYVNAFDYDYDTPRRGLEITVEGGPSPFDGDNHLVRVGVQAEVVADGERPPVSLTFVIDTSGSMDRDDRLGLVKDSLEVLVDELNDDDTVAIVIYADGAGVVLEPTEVRDSRRIYDAIDDLRSGGSTNLESGLREGYEMARRAFREDGINRVIIASDGVANAGITDVNELGRIIRADADAGIQLVTVGYGMGNFNDVTMEQLADNGDGFYAYVDTIDEAERLFEDELTSTLVTAAIDAKIQVEFDPEVVDEYRLIGFENRGVRDSDFRNDSVDAGELGAGHQVTALYEVALHRGVDIDDRGDIGEVFLRWEDPEDGQVIEIDEDIDLRDVEHSFGETTESFQLATVVASFAEVLRDNPYADDVRLGNVLVEAERLADTMDTDEVDALVEMIERAEDLA